MSGTYDFAALQYSYETVTLFNNFSQLFSNFFDFHFPTRLEKQNFWDLDLTVDTKVLHINGHIALHLFQSALYKSDNSHIS